MTKNDQPSFAQTVDMLMKESDRGALLVGIALLDDALVDLLKKLLRLDKEVLRLFDPNMPLGSFSSRIELAWSLNLINDLVRRDLHLLRRTRNDFAHRLDVLDFDTPAVGERLRTLNIPAEVRGTPNAESPKVCFRLCLMSLYRYIMNRVEGHIPLGQE
ncbi:MAG: hypothetical protein U0610_18000 [bacterium]